MFRIVLNKIPTYRDFERHIIIIVLQRDFITTEKQ